MRWSRIAVALFGLTLLAANGPAARAGGPLWHRSARVDYKVAADGASVAAEQWEVRADTNAIAHTIAQQSFSFAADLESVDVVAAYTRKKDGRILPVGPASIMDKAVTTVAMAPQFTAQVARTIVFPQVAAGDTVHYELRRTSREPMFAGEFLLSLELGSAGVMEQAEIAIAAPQGRAIRTAATGLQEDAPALEAGTLVRRWHLASGAAGAVSLQASTLPDYEALGRAYALRAAKPARPGKAVRALAARLIPRGTSEADSVKLLYRYVASEIRYVAAFFGAGRVVPRDAETVLAEGWGDCKDHTALLQALLASQGIDSAPALITLRTRYDMPDPPGLSTLDHVITYVPSLDLFLDSTSPYAPFGMLPAGEYDKPVVVADQKHPHLGRTPPMPPGSVSLVTRTEAWLGLDGSVTGETTTIAAGPQSIALRSMAGWFEARGSTAAATSHLQQLGTPGEGRYAFVSPDDVGDEYRVAGQFVLDQKVADDLGAAFAVPAGLSVFGRPGKLLVPSGLTEDGGHACFPGSEVEQVRLEMPNWTTIHTLPADVDVQSGGARYTARYAAEPGALVVRREFVLRTGHERCSPEEYDDMRPALEAALRDQRATVALTHADPPVASGEKPPKAVASVTADTAVPAATGARDRRVAATP